MPKATIRLPNGTVIIVDGAKSDVKDILGFAAGGRRETSERHLGERTERKPSPTPATAQTPENADGDTDHLAQIINQIKNCSEAEKIEAQILDQTSQVNRALLPLYIAHEYMKGHRGLTTGEISKVTKDLGTPISGANVSHTFAGSAMRYVMTRGIRKRGQPTLYSLNRRGVQYIKSVLAGATNG